MPITQNLMQTLENQNTQNSTNLTLSCKLQTELNANKCNKEEEETMIPDDDGTQNLLQILENRNTQTLSCEFRTKQEQKEVSTTLTLLDKSWVSSNNMRKSTKKTNITQCTHITLITQIRLLYISCSTKQLI